MARHLSDDRARRLDLALGKAFLQCHHGWDLQRVLVDDADEHTHPQAFDVLFKELKAILDASNAPYEARIKMISGRMQDHLSPGRRHRLLASLRQDALRKKRRVAGSAPVRIDLPHDTAHHLEWVAKAIGCSRAELLAEVARALLEGTVDRRPDGALRALRSIIKRAYKDPAESAKETVTP